jgi:arginase
MHETTIHGVLYDANSSFMMGAAEAPSEIRRAFNSPSANMATELGVDLDLNPYWHDAGDLAVSGWPSAEASVAIRAATETLLQRGQRVLTLGGDHSLTFPVVAAHTELYPRLGVLHIDAHGDIYEDFAGNPYSHASPFARLLENNYLGRLVQVGIRTLTAHQRQQIARYRVETHEMKDWRGSLDVEFDGPFYLSIDLDAMDPAHCPGVSHHEPGGLTVREVISLIHRVKGQLVGADIVELNPRRDVNGMTAMVAARLAKEVLGRLVTGAGRQSAI